MNEVLTFIRKFAFVPVISRNKDLAGAETYWKKAGHCLQPGILINGQNYHNTRRQKSKCLYFFMGYGLFASLLGVGAWPYLRNHGGKGLRALSVCKRSKHSTKNKEL